MSLSSFGMVLAVEVGLKDGMDSISVFIIHPSWKTEHGSSGVSVMLRNVMFGQLLVKALISLSRTHSVARLIFLMVLVK